VGTHRKNLRKNKMMHSILYLVIGVVVGILYSFVMVKISNRTVFYTKGERRDNRFKKYRPHH
jgi:hypothetical protein